ncbi:MAG: hypothetical protein VKI83_07870 [Synechococcaceae cyanobacterium]|nr:hypothetical protein [Synechococcaceae cyanobacterium]
MLKTHIQSFLSMLKDNLRFGSDRKASLDVTLPIRGPLKQRNLRVEFWAEPEPPGKDSVTGMAIEGGLRVSFDPPLVSHGGSGGGAGYSATFSYALPKGPLTWEDSLGNMWAGVMAGSAPFAAPTGWAGELLSIGSRPSLFNDSPFH